MIELPSISISLLASKTSEKRKSSKTDPRSVNLTIA